MGAPFTPSDAARVRAAAAQSVDEYHVPGLAVGVVSGTELAYAEGFGHADIESGRRQAPALRQRIGSITKTMTALCAMALVDEGRLSLDDRLIDSDPRTDVPRRRRVRARPAPPHPHVRHRRGRDARRCA